MGVGLEEAEQLIGHFLATRIAGMGAIADQIAALPNEPVAFARRGSVGPEVRAPKQQRRFHIAPFRIVIQVGVLIDLTLNQPAHDESTFVRTGFRVESSVGISSVDATSQIGDPQIWKVVRIVREITVSLSPFAPRKQRCFRGAKGDTNSSNDPK